MKRRFNRFRPLAEIISLLAIDAILVVSIFHLAVLIRTKVLPRIYAGFSVELPFRGFYDIWWIFSVWLFFFFYEGLYTKRFSYWNEIKTALTAAFFSTVGIFAIVSALKLSGSISRTIIIIMGVLSLLFFPPIRITAKKWLKKLGLFKRKVLILGAGETGRLIAHALRKEQNYGYKVVGFLDDDPEKVGTIIDGIKVHRGVDRAADYLRRCDIKDIFIAMPGAEKNRIQGLINYLQHRVDKVFLVPDMFGIAVVGTSLHHFFHEQAFAIEVKNNLEEPLKNFIKRCFDIFMSALLLPVFFVLMATIALLIKMDSPGPIIFSQERIGRYGRRFRCFKFRTMYVDAEEQFEKLLVKNPEAAEEWKHYWKLKDDPRVTTVGKFLRRTSIDELPQLFNVLKGEMSLIGPRPYLPREMALLSEFGNTILLARPGMSGLWQVSGRSNNSYSYRLALDSWYVRNWNLWLDIVILLNTCRVILKREGAY